MLGVGCWVLSLAFTGLSPERLAHIVYSFTARSATVTAKRLTGEAHPYGAKRHAYFFFLGTNFIAPEFMQ